MSNPNPIVLKAPRISDECIGTVRLTPEAEKVVRRLRAKTNLPIRQIVSEIIVQAENLIDIDTADDEIDSRFFDREFGFGFSFAEHGDTAVCPFFIKDAGQHFQTVGIHARSILHHFARPVRLVDPLAPELFFAGIEVFIHQISGVTESTFAEIFQNIIPFE